MTPDHMRTIDHWLGIPLCFLLSLIRKLIFWKGRSRPKKILFIELSEMGSTILADPAMRKAERMFGAELFFVIFRRNAASLKFINTVPEENIFTIREDNIYVLIIDTLLFLLWTRRHRIDSVVDLELFSRFTALLTGLCGASYRVGFHRFHNEGLYRGDLLTHRVSYNPHLHIAKNFIALVNALGSEKPEKPFSKTQISDAELVIPKTEILPNQISDMQERVKKELPDFVFGQNRLVLINPNASDLLPQRRWPVDHFVRVSQRILTVWPDVMILLTGSPEERAEANILAHKVANRRLANFAGHLLLHELPLIYNLSSLMISNDSGPAHFAAVTDMPTIVLFGPETPTLYHSLGRTIPLTANLACSPCVSAANHRKTDCSEPVCMQLLSPDMVMEAVATVL